MNIEPIKYTLDDEHNERAEHFAKVADKINELCEAFNNRWPECQNSDCVCHKPN
jgi:hypothetical protein